MQIPPSYITVLIDDWAKRYPADEWFVMWFRDHTYCQWTAIINGDWEMHQVEYNDNPHVFSGLHRRYVLAIVTVDNDNAMEIAEVHTTSEDSRLVIIR